MTSRWEHNRPINRPDKTVSAIANAAYIRRTLTKYGVELDVPVMEAMRKEGCRCGYHGTASLRSA